MRDVFKVQKPLLHAGGGEPQFLVYNRSREITFQCPLREDIERHFADGEMKVFVSASIDGDGVFSIIEKVAPEAW